LHVVGAGATSKNRSDLIEPMVEAGHAVGSQADSRHRDPGNRAGSPGEADLEGESSTAPSSCGVESNRSGASI